MKSFSNDIILNCINEIPQETMGDFLIEFCRAIQKRKDELISINGFDPFPDSYDTKTPKGIDPIRYMIAQKIAWASLQENTHIEPDSTEAALQRVEELKRKYTPEQIAEMRKLRAEVEEMVAKFDAVDKDRNLSDEDKKQAKLTLLKSYGVQKYRGKKIDGDPIAFVERSDTYGRFIEAEVIFKADVRKMDKELVAILNQEIHRSKHLDPLVTEERLTELQAAGVLGSQLQQRHALGYISTRDANRNRMRIVKGTL